MKFELIGELQEIFNLQSISDKFTKREFLLKCKDGDYEQTVLLQLVNNNCGLLDNFSIGDTLRVNFNIRSNSWTKEGVTRYIISLTARKIEGLETSVNPERKPMPKPWTVPQASNDDLPF